MKKYKVEGTSNSILLNKDMGYFAVSYYDNNIISIYDYDTGSHLNSLNTIYCSASSNLLAGNEKYFIYQFSAKELIVADAKTFKQLHTIKLSHCGAVNTISLKNDILLVSANKAIGNSLDKYQNIFLFDLVKGSSAVFTDGRMYIKKSMILDNSIISLFNDKDAFGYVNISLGNKVEIECSTIDAGNPEYFNRILSNKDLYIVANINTDGVDKFKIYKIDEVTKKSINIEHDFENIDIHTGLIKDKKSFLIGYDNSIGKYTLLETNGFSGRLGNTVLGVSVITEAIAADDNHFCFGADKTIYFVEV